MPQAVGTTADFPELINTKHAFTVGTTSFVRGQGGIPSAMGVGVTSHTIQRSPSNEKRQEPDNFTDETEGRYLVMPLPTYLPDELLPENETKIVFADTARPNREGKVVSPTEYFLNLSKSPKRTRRFKSKTSMMTNRPLPKQINPLTKPRSFKDDLVALKLKQACLVNVGSEAHLTLNSVARQQQS